MLYKNKIVKIDRNSWAGLVSLEKLDLSGNHLTSLPSHIFSLNRSLFIDLTSIEFVTFPREISGSGTARVITLHLDGNPMNCDSRLCWLKEAEEAGWIAWEDFFGPRVPAVQKLPASQLDEYYAEL